MLQKSEKTIRELHNELLRRQREDPLKNLYKPNPRQREVHENRALITLVVGGNRTGKTWSAVAEALYYLLNRSVYARIPDYPLHIWYVMPSLTQFRRAVLPVVKKLCPPDVFSTYDKRDHVLHNPVSGSYLHFVSADMQQRRLQGARVDFCVMDEAMEKAVYNELNARLIDSKGRMLMVLTPVDKDVTRWLWIRDDLYIPGKLGDRSDIQIIHMPMADAEGNPLVPHLTKEDVDRMIQQYPDPTDRAARIYGEFVTKTGLVFGSLDTDTHLIPRFDIPPEWHRWVVCDPQYHRFAALFFAADEDGTYYIWDEYFSQDELLVQRAKVMKAKLGYVERHVPVYVDYANQQDIAELNMHFSSVDANLAAMELPVKKQVHRMILRTHSMLEPSYKRQYNSNTGLEGIYGAPRLLIFDDLQTTWIENGRPLTASRLLWEMKHLTWGRNGKPDKNSAGGADCCDCLIYGCSIVAFGVKPVVENDWEKNLSSRDISIWRQMADHDRRMRRWNS